jgi:hypothetical protein
VPVIQLRELGSVGIIKDVNPTSIPNSAWSDGINVRFNGHKVERSPAFRTFASVITPAIPVFVWGLYNQGGYDSIVYAGLDGRLFKYASGTETNVSEGGHVNNNDPRPYTGCVLSSCVYLNRPDQAPRVLTPGAATFVNLANWPAATTCAALRSFKSYLVALNTTETGVNYPLRVRTSDRALENVVPASWDETDTTKLAIRNALSQAKTPIVDGGELGDNFIIYTRDECWRMRYVGGTFIFDYDRLPFDNSGLINQNCWVEVDGKHYAWSDTDIYLHDGTSRTSIIDQRNREVFFRELNMSKSGVFFVAHDKAHNEVLFCGVSGAEAAKLRSTAYCNYAAVYNYKTNTWSFCDLPNVTSATVANANTVYTWTTVPAGLTWDNIGGSWYDQEDSFSRFLMFAIVQDTTNGISVSKIDVRDFADLGKLALPLDSDANVNPRAFVERTGFELDVEGADLRSYKIVRQVIPLSDTTNSGVSFNIYGGEHNMSGQGVTWGPPVSYNPKTQYKVDTRIGGRYLAVRFEMPTVNDFSLPGADLDVIITGRR